MTPLQRMLQAMGALPQMPPTPQVTFQPALLTRSHRVFMVNVESQFSATGMPQPVVVAWSPEVFNQLSRGVRWHDDESEHCRTWSGGCRCDLGDEA